MAPSENEFDTSLHHREEWRYVYDILYRIQQSPGGSEDVSHANIWGRVLGSGNSE